MKHTELWAPMPEPLEKLLRADCERCSGLCCKALYFSRSDGFPADKPAGVPCSFLMEDCRCRIHGELAARGLSGCRAYDCLGAGQRAQSLGADATPEERYRCFEELFVLHQMLLFLTQVSLFRPLKGLREQARKLLEQSGEAAAGICRENGGLPQDYRREGNGLLRLAGEELERQFSPMGAAQRKKKSPMLAGKKFRGMNLDGRDLSMTLLIAADLRECSLTGANFLGADLRDTDVRGADLSHALFLTPGQLGAARGDRGTNLPPFLYRPSFWEIERPSVK